MMAPKWLRCSAEKIVHSHTRAENIKKNVCAYDDKNFSERFAYF